MLSIFTSRTQTTVAEQYPQSSIIVLGIKPKLHRFAPKNFAMILSVENNEDEAEKKTSTFLRISVFTPLL